MTLQIYISADKTDFRGPFTHNPPLLPGETPLTITSAQYAALNAVRKANPGATQYAFDGKVFTVAKIEQCRLGMLAIIMGLPKWAQELYKPQVQGAYDRFKIGDVAGVQQIIQASGKDMPDPIPAAKTALLNLITSLYGVTPPSVN